LCETSGKRDGKRQSKPRRASMTDLEIAHKHCDDEGPIPIWFRHQVLAAIAEARRDERERCAKLCEDEYGTDDFSTSETIAVKCAIAIRALGEAK
jgi:hypothetical protein